MSVKEKSKGFFGEFKTFITRGNVLDMAVGIIVGSAFTAIVNSLVNQVIMPVVGLLVGGVNFSSLRIVLKAATDTTAEVALEYGAFLQQVVNFFIIALAVFAMVKAINAFHRKKEKQVETQTQQELEKEPAPSAELLMLTEIRDLLKTK